MKIAQIAPYWIRTLPRNGNSGTEWVVSYLTGQLEDLGHDVTFCNALTKAKRWSWFANPTATNNYDISDGIIHISMAHEYTHENHFDIIHNHSYHLGSALLCIADIPSVTTNRISLDTQCYPNTYYLHDAFSKRHRYTSVSKRQQELTLKIKWAMAVLTASIYFCTFEYIVNNE